MKFSQRMRKLHKKRQLHEKQITWEDMDLLVPVLPDRVRLTAPGIAWTNYIPGVCRDMLRRQQFQEAMRTAITALRVREKSVLKRELQLAAREVAVRWFETAVERRQELAAEREQALLQGAEDIDSCIATCSMASRLCRRLLRLRLE
jgi:hypothetical protein